MTNKLPINLNTGITNECWTFLRLAALLSDNKYFPWYFEKFNYYFIDEQFNFSYEGGDSTGSLCYYDEVIEFKNLNKNVEIIDTIIKEINNGGYVLLYCDRFYVKGSKEYEKYHNPHDMIIYGYDNHLELFNFIDININGVLWGEHTIKFEELKNAYESTHNMISENPEKWFWIYWFNLPASSLYLKNFNRGPRLEVFYIQIEKCLAGGEVLSYERTDKQIINKVKRYGVSVYRSYYEDLYNVLIHNEKNFLIMEGNEHILLKMKSLVEIKHVLTLKLKYLNQTGLAIIPEGIVNNAQRLCKVIESAFHLIIKYSTNLDLKTLENAKSRFIEAESVEISLLTEVKDILYDHIKRGLIT